MTLEVSTAALAGGLALSYAQHGDASGQALVLIPGPTDSWRSYEAVLERLPRSIRAIAVSPRGHGDSDKPAAGYAVENFAADVVPLLDTLRIERAVVAGHSGSCLVARRVAIDCPERVTGLVLEASPTTLQGDAQLVQFVKSVVATLEDPVDADFARTFLADTSSSTLEPEVLDVLAREVLKVPARVWHEMFAGLLQYDDVADLAHIAAPVLLLWGDADPLVSRAMQDELAARLPRAEFVVYAGVGHTPRWERPARFAADVAAFVERLGG